LIANIVDCILRNLIQRGREIAMAPKKQQLSRNANPRLMPVAVNKLKVRKGQAPH
jgi:hypothetical protein